MEPTVRALEVERRKTIFALVLWVLAAVALNGTFLPLFFKNLAISQALFGENPSPVSARVMLGISTLLILITATLALCFRHFDCRHQSGKEVRRSMFVRAIIPAIFVNYAVIQVFAPYIRANRSNDSLIMSLFLFVGCVPAWSFLFSYVLNTMRHHQLVRRTLYITNDA